MACQDGVWNLLDSRDWLTGRDEFDYMSEG